MNGGRNNYIVNLIEGGRWRRRVVGDTPLPTGGLLPTSLPPLVHWFTDKLDNLYLALDTVNLASSDTLSFINPRLSCVVYSVLRLQPFILILTRFQFPKCQQEPVTIALLVSRFFSNLYIFCDILFKFIH